MTWAEFKRQVEAAGVVDDLEIRYIDVGMCTEIEVKIHDKGFGQTFTVLDA